MNCPVCNKHLAATLSICTSCGAMMNDSVREELGQPKVTSSGSLRKAAPVEENIHLSFENSVRAKEAVSPIAVAKAVTQVAMPETQREPQSLVLTEPLIAEMKTERKTEIPAKPIRRDPGTSANMPKPTDQTLKGFQPQSASVPDWRLAVANAVKQRRTGTSTVTKSEVVRSEHPEIAKLDGAVDPRLSRALDRVARSREAFKPSSRQQTTELKVEEETRSQKYPNFGVINGDESQQTPAKARVNTLPRPRLISSLKIEKKPFDTNKLPQIGEVVAAPVVEQEKIEIRREEIIEIENEEIIDNGYIDYEEEIVETEFELTEDVEEFDDIAPFAMRFNAGLFDFLIGGFVTLLLVTPFAFFGGNWFSLTGLVAIAVTFMVVMFVYLTTAVGLFGQTIGMNMFGLELIDVEENTFPTLKQSAISSSVFLASTALLGIGFIPALLNDEQRTAHDLLSGTILVRQ